ncbi:hypothetical protein PoB_003076100 [Plakobranchus ocellatus]|uniref:Uncharacterized protein n=1 Tax=Plakobranchus ocellatus TaxID=259542 RepID=A0AAV3ZZ53_9GAST|nr:hypothetical protein PoB_003076100 [Plakobranchus ocellatus]
MWSFRLDFTLIMKQHEPDANPTLPDSNAKLFITASSSPTESHLVPPCPTESHQMPPNTPERHRVPPSITERSAHHRVLPNTAEHHRMPPSTICQDRTSLSTLVFN